ncbi:MAG TPA: HEPN domain-containing protein, partial [Chthoniobacterales bacterium]
MPAPDLDGPLSDFMERTKQTREIMGLVESAARSPNALISTRQGIDLSGISLQTGNTANSMALIFLASSFEEFVREEAVQCANHLMDTYASMPELTRHAIRNAYWNVSTERLRYAKSMFIENKPNLSAIAQVRVALEAIQSFVINDDPSKLIGASFGHHSNNFRPDIVSEIFARFKIKKIIAQIADNAKLKTYFGVPMNGNCEKSLFAKWNEFYDRRNETVHSLGGSSGYAVDAVMSY